LTKVFGSPERLREIAGLNLHEFPAWAEIEITMCSRRVTQWQIETGATILTAIHRDNYEFETYRNRRAGAPALLGRAALITK
jgi:hypothetical protein